MKSTGIIRKIDTIGRLVIPMEIRKRLGIKARDRLEISLEEGRIILTKYQTSCVFCEGFEDISAFKGKNVCAKCREKLRKE